MIKNKKILIGSLIGIGLLTTLYVFVYRNRKPKLKFTNKNWGVRSVNAEFGNTPVVISEFNRGNFMAGSNFNSNYVLELNPIGKGRVDIIIRNIKDNEVESRRQVDFDSRLIKNLI